MQKIYVKVDDLFFIESVFRKWIYVNGKKEATFSDNITCIEVEEGQAELKLKTYFKYLSSKTTLNVEAGENYLVAFSSKLHLYGNIGAFLVITFCMLHIIFSWNILGMRTLFCILWGYLLLYAFAELITRKRHYSIKTEKM